MPKEEAEKIRIIGSNSRIKNIKLLTGIGPVTSALPMRRTTDCATAAYYLINREFPFTEVYCII